ncbi:Hypothetical predicted protein [Mytilus galloprovincialis]|uniref:Uncharacterized protein n=1 Tax=Mytilus galloprovincialis TaxID=29158 RepID=A0A8B6GFR3_MYTGA|nr:Hypothetical predicted protein [Mytilus galloprovincialis]
MDRDKNITIKPHTIADKITGSGEQSQTSTAKRTSSGEKDQMHSSKTDRKILMKSDMVPRDEKKTRYLGLITSRPAVHDTAEYDTKVDHLSVEQVIASDTSSLHEDYQVDQNIYSQENINIIPLNFSDEITESDKQSETSTEHVSTRKERERTHTASKDREVLRKRDIVSTEEKRTRDDRLIKSKHTVDDTAEYDSQTNNLSDETALARDTSSLHETYQVDQNIYSQENIIPDQIIEKDSQSETSTEHVSSITEREKEHTATKDKRIFRKSDMVSKDVKRARDSGLITSKQAFEDTAQYDPKIKYKTDQPVVSRDVSSRHEEYEDKDAKIILRGTQDVHQQFNKENETIEPHSSAGQITDSEHHSRTSTEQITSIKDKEETDILTSDSMTSMKRYVRSIDEIRARTERLMIPTHSVDTTKEYKTTTVSVSDEPVKSSYSSLFYFDLNAGIQKVILSDSKDVLKMDSDKNVMIKLHTIPDKITASGEQSQTSTAKRKITGKKDQAHFSKTDRKILMKSDMIPRDEKKARDSGLITSSQAVHDTAETDTKVDHLSDQPVIASDTSSLHEHYQVNQNICSQENINSVPLNASDEITDGDKQSKTSTEHVSRKKERERTHTATKDREILRQTDIVSTDEKRTREDHWITSKNTVDDTTEYDSNTDNLSDKTAIARDTSSLHETYQVDQNIYSQENIIPAQITKKDTQSETSTEHVSSIKEREKEHTATKDKRIFRKSDMVSTDVKRARDSGLITSKQAFEDTAQYDLKMEYQTDQPVVSRDTKSRHKEYVDKDARIILSDTQDVLQQFNKKNDTIEPRFSAGQITDRENLSRTSTEQITSIKDKEETDISTSDSMTSMKRYVRSIDEIRARTERLMTPKHSVDTTKEYKTTTVSVSDEPVKLSYSSLFDFDLNAGIQKVVLSDSKDDLKMDRDKNITLKPHTIADKITESGKQSQTSTAKRTSSGEKDQMHSSKTDRKILMKSDMVPRDEKKARYLASDTSSLHEDYQVDQNIYSQENINIIPLNFSDEITESDKQSETSTEHVSTRKERERTHTASKDREVLRKRDIVSTEEKRTRDDRLIKSKHTVDDTAEYDSQTNNLSDETALARDTSSLHETYQVDQNIYSQENIIPDQIIEKDSQSETSTEHVSSITEREKEHTATKDKRIFRKSDMVSKDVKRARDSGLITSKQAFEDTAQYDPKIKYKTDQPVVSRDVSSRHEEYEDKDAKIILRGTQDVHQQFNKENETIEPHSSAGQITDSEHHSRTSTEQITSIKDKEETDILTSDSMTSMKRYCAIELMRSGQD